MGWATWRCQQRAAGRGRGQAAAARSSASAFDVQLASRQRGDARGAAAKRVGVGGGPGASYLLHFLRCECCPLWQSGVCPAETSHGQGATGTPFANSFHSIAAASTNASRRRRPLAAAQISRAGRGADGAGGGCWPSSPGSAADYGGVRWGRPSRASGGRV